MTRSFHRGLASLAMWIWLAATAAQAQFSQEQVQQITEARQLYDRALALDKQGKPKEALELTQQHVAIHQKVLGEHPFTAGAINNLGMLVQSQGDYAAALPYLEQALAMKRKTRGEEHLDTALGWNNVASLLQNMGDYAGARLKYERALEIRQLAIKRGMLRPDDPDLAVSLNNLGSVLQAQGDFAAARPLQEQALKILRAVRGESHPQTGTLYTNLGNLFKAQGDYVAARAYYEQSLQIYQKAMGDHEDTATCLNNLGILLEVQEDYVGARPFLEQALAMRQKVQGAEHPRTALSHNNLALVMQWQREFAEARRHYEAALSIYKKSLGEAHTNTALTLQNLGFLAFHEQDYAGARPFYEQALKIYGKAVGYEHPDAARTLNNLVNLAARQGNWQDAAQTMEKLRRGVRQHVARVLPSLSDREQLMFLQVNDERKFHAALALGLLRLKDRDVADLSAGWLLNGKGMAQEAVAARTLLTRESANPQLRPLVAQLLEIRRQLATLSLASPKAGQEQARTAKLAQLTADEQNLSRQLMQASGQTASAAWVELDEVRQALPKDGVLIDIARFKIIDFQEKDLKKNRQPAHYAAWIIPPAGRDAVQIVDLGPADAIESAVERVRDAVAGAGRADSPLQTAGEAAAEKDALATLQRASDLVWKPLAGDLGAAKRLILSPDGALWLLPWGALPVAKDQCLQQYPLQFVISGRNVVQPPQAESKTSAPSIFADPDFDLTPAATRQAIQAIFPGQRLESGEQTRGLIAKTALPPVQRLTNTAVEAQLAAPSIAKFAGVEPVSYTATYALESVAKRVQRPKLLLFATHGFFLPDQELKPSAALAAVADTRSVPLITAEGKPIENPLLRCGLLLTGCNAKESAGGDDGILTGMEIVGIDLRGTELVVLSACETGIGKVNNGEGVAGLRQAFQLAGAQAVVSTLWQVPDRDSALIMNDFFANLADGKSKADALRDAQLKRIASRREKYDAAHPFFWAAWTVTGN